MFQSNVATRAERGAPAPHGHVHANAQSRRSALRSGATLQLFLIVCLAAWAVAAETAQPPSSAAFEAFQKAKVRAATEPQNTEAAWQMGRACFDLAEFATNNTERAELAQQGITACQRALAGASNSAPAHYYLGLNIGQLARTKSLGALKLVGQMEQEWNAARKLDERLDHAGPDRSLGLLYRDAPSLLSVGNRTQARQHLQHALDLAPDFPENRLNLIESELEWGYKKDALLGLKQLDAAWPVARTNYAGTAWKGNWTDWDQRAQKLRKALNEPSRTVESPRGKERSTE
jgi:tetratricopeptide (TPR) repeat protein